MSNYHTEIEKEFQQLMESKWDFFRKLSPAERAKLTISYEKLQDTWSRNLIGRLNEDLDTNSQELKSIQSEINQNWSILEKKLESELKQDILKKSQLLSRVKANSDSALEQLKAKLEQKKENAKKDIIERKIALSQEEKKLKNLSGSMTMLGDLRQQLERSKVLLKMKSNQLEEESKKLSQTESWLLSNLNSLKTRNSIELKEKESELKQNWQQSLNGLRSEEEQFQQLLNKIEKEQLQRLRIEISAEIPNLRKELKNLLIAGELSMIGTMHKNLMIETETLMTALRKGLTRAGLDVDEYFQKMDQNMV